MPYGIASPTIGSGAARMFSYVSTGATFALHLGFVPSFLYAQGGSNTWTWNSNLAFGQALGTTTRIATAGVLDSLNGSGNASTNVATTSPAIGLLIGTDSTVNPGSALTFTGFALP